MSGSAGYTLTVDITEAFLDCPDTIVACHALDAAHKTKNNASSSVVATKEAIALDVTRRDVTYAKKALVGRSSSFFSAAPKPSDDTLRSGFCRTHAQKTKIAPTVEATILGANNRGDQRTYRNTKRLVREPICERFARVTCASWNKRRAPVKCVSFQRSRPSAENKRSRAERGRPSSRERSSRVSSSYRAARAT